MTNPENKFPEKYDKTIRRIKRRLKKNPDVSESQVKSYNSRALAPSGAFLMTHIDLIQELLRDKERLEKLWKEQREEASTLKMMLQNGSKKYNELKDHIIEEHGEKSYEYQQVFLMKDSS
mgnify:CR=1 FL=1